MRMIEEKQIGSVQVESTKIVFTDKENKKVYKTGVIIDSTLTERLYAVRAEFAKNIEKPVSSLLSLLLTFGLPLLIFVLLGRYMNKSLWNRWAAKILWLLAWAKVIRRFTFFPLKEFGSRMWQGKTRLRKVLQKLWTICTIRKNIQRSGPRCLRGCFLWVFRKPEKRCLPKR